MAVDKLLDLSEALRLQIEAHSDAVLEGDVQVRWVRAAPR